MNTPNARTPIPTYTFALVVVKVGRKVALVRSRKDGMAWALPGGRVQIGEELLSAARRHVFEETGLPIELEGLLRIQHTLVDGGEARLRVCLVARPADDRSLKTVAEGAGTCQWFTREQLATQSVRRADVSVLIDLALDGPVYPLSALSWES